ncbi:putative Alpha/Beta hydrolase protein [Seiridium unicorne]|uniref:feruloyl esterase n=1 Tax=Seiridium unicorne TaxID=138068 RepID=A0ABR2UTA7_9PEZI
MHLLKVIPFVVSGVLAASGCSKTPSFKIGSLSSNQTVLTDRRYKVFLPQSYDHTKKTPLILSYHGANRQIEDQVALDELTNPFFNKDYIVVYLQGSADDPDREDHTTWEGAPENDSDDFSFTTAVLDTLESSLCIDTSRIYATGKSQGGGFVGRLACHHDLSQRIAAFAPVSGAYYISQLSVKQECEDPATVEIPCDAGREGIPIMAFHGGADPSINYDGEFRSYCLPSVRHWAEDWAQRNGLNVSKEDNSTIKGSDNGVTSSWGGGLVNLVYDGDNIEHDWPSLLQNSDNEGGPRSAFNATAWIVDFFGKHSLP